MKTLFLILLCPIILTAQSGVPHYIENINVEFSLDFIPEDILAEDDIILQNHHTGRFDKNNTIELLITVEVFLIEAWMPEMPTYKTVMNLLPKYLDTFSLTGTSFKALKHYLPENNLNELVATNDSMFLKEDTMRNWLAPVKYGQHDFDGLQRMTEGFGPRFTF